MRIASGIDKTKQGQKQEAPEALHRVEAIALTRGEQKRFGTPSRPSIPPYKRECPR